MDEILSDFNYEEKVIRAVKEHTVTLITKRYMGEKTSLIPTLLKEQGYKVFISEPRKASTVELEIDDTIKLIQKLIEAENEKKVLIINGIFNWKLYVELLIALVNQRLKVDNLLKVVITMSETLEYERLTKYFEADVYHIHISNTLFSVESGEKKEQDLIPTIMQLIEEEKKTLVFVAGKKEIRDVVEKIRSKTNNVVVLPFHGDLNSWQQQKCFNEYACTKVIVSTNRALYVNIPDIEAVVDTGLEKTELENEIKKICLRNISQAECLQRKNILGKTSHGKYFLCSDVTFKSRERYHVPEIEISDLSYMILKLLMMGIEISELNFFHQPKAEAVESAINTLMDLEAIEENNKITLIGEQMSEMPISTKYARMIVDADEIGLVRDAIVIASILRVGSLLNENASYLDFTREANSDLLAELDVWMKIRRKKEIDLDNLNINRRKYDIIKELIERLQEAIGEIEVCNQNRDRKSLRALFISMMVKNTSAIHVAYSHFNVTDGEGNLRSIDYTSCCKNRWIVVGIPQIIECKELNGEVKTKNFLSLITKMTFDEVKQLVPQIISYEEGEPYYSCVDDVVKVRKKTYLKKFVIKQEEISIPNHPTYERLKEKQSKIRENHSNNVMIDGKSFEVHRDRSLETANVYLDDYTLYHTSIKSMRLNDGEQVLFCSDTDKRFKANNISYLRKMVEEQRIKNAWEKKREFYKKIEVNFSLDSVLEIQEQYLGKKIVTFADGGYGEPIYGYVCIGLKDKTAVQLELLEDEEKAEKKTQEFVKRLYLKTVSDRYPDKKFKLKKRIPFLSSKERNAKSKFDSEVHRLQENLEIGNIKERIDYLKELFEKLIK